MCETIHTRHERLKLNLSLNFATTILLRSTTLWELFQSSLPSKMRHDPWFWKLLALVQGNTMRHPHSPCHPPLGCNILLALSMGKCLSHHLVAHIAYRLKPEENICFPPPPHTCLLRRSRHPPKWPWLPSLLRHSPCWWTPTQFSPKLWRKEKNNPLSWVLVEWKTWRDIMIQRNQTSKNQRSVNRFRAWYYELTSHIYIPLFGCITIFCGIDNVLWNIPTFSLNMGNFIHKMLPIPHNNDCETQLFITLFKPIAMFCETDGILQSIPHIQTECEEYSKTHCQSDTTLLWIWIILWNSQNTIISP